MAKIVFRNKDFHDAERGKRYVSQAIESTLSYGLHYFSFSKVSAIVDFLRSKGYALPAYGHSIEELIKEEVFKLVK